MINRILILFSLILLPLAGDAQADHFIVPRPRNELGIFISTSQFDDSEITDGIDTVDVEFDEEMGFGVLYNRFWTNSLSTEFAYQRLGADLTLSFQDVATLDLDILSATGQFHFARGPYNVVSPYVGGGVAYVSGEAGAIDEDELGATDLESAIEFLANAGLSVGIGRSLSLYLDGKYILYEARGEDDAPEDEPIDVNPLIISAGVRFRF